MSDLEDHLRSLVLLPFDRPVLLVVCSNVSTGQFHIR